MGKIYGVACLNGLRPQEEENIERHLKTFENIVALSKWLLYVDDDGILAPPTADFLASFCKQRQIGFKLLMSVEDARNILPTLPASSICIT